MENNRIHIPTYLRVLFVLLLLIVIIYILTVAKGLLIPIFLAGFISMLFTPVGNWLERHRIPRVWSALISLLTALIFIGGLITLFILQVRSFSRDIEDVSERLNRYLQDIEVFLSDKLGIESGIGAGIDNKQILGYIQDNSNTLGEFILNTVGSFTSALMLPVFIFFFLIYRDHLMSFAAKLFKQHDEEKVKEEIRSLRRIVQSYITGVIKVMLVLSVLNTIALFSLGIKHALFFAIFAGILNIIPFLGPFIGAVFPVIFAFLTKDSLFYPLAVIACFTIIQLFESNFLTPRIVGKNVSLNPFITLLGLLIGGTIWGVIGMILIIPTLAIMRKIFDLQEHTRPFAFLLGEEVEEKKKDDPVPVEE